MLTRFTLPHRCYPYVLRLWREIGAEPDAWRASVEDTGTGEARRFASLEELTAFLEAQMEEARAFEPALPGS
jgi:hypothetical protein